MRNHSILACSLGERFEELGNNYIVGERVVAKENMIFREIIQQRIKKILHIIKLGYSKLTNRNVDKHFSTGVYSFT